MDGNPYPELDGFPDLTTGNPLDTDAEKAGDKAKRTRAMSAIDFPYVDLDQTILVPETIHTKLGTKGLAEQLGGAMGLSGGSYARRMAAAKMFGFIEKDGEYFKITDLGRRVLNEDTAPAAKVEAFLNVGLYKRLYDDFRGASLPGDQGIENHMRELGVPDKATESARQIFRRVARQAGFFPYGEGKLVMPVVREGPPPPPDGVEQDKTDLPPSPADGKSNGNGAPNPEVEQLRRTVEELNRKLQVRPVSRAESPDLPVAVTGVLTLLPLNDGDKWTDADLSEWMTMFRGVIRRSFKDRIAAPAAKE